jgi:hypothetical protein
MGSYCSLRFDEIDITGAKSFVPDHLVSLFQESDRQDLEIEQDGEARTQHLYVADRQIVLDRLDILGFTSAAAKQSFNEWYKGEVETWTSYADDGSDWALPKLSALRALTFDKWRMRAPEILSTECSR